MFAKVACSVMLTSIMLLNCSENSSNEVTKRPEPEIPEEEQHDSIPVDSTYSECDTFIAEHIGIGTACCISGYLVAKPGDTATYHYQINYPDAKVSSWIILDGDISILAINDPETVTVIMGSNFTGGIIQAVASGAYDSQTRLTCNDHIVITASP